MDISYEQNNNGVSIFTHDIHPPTFHSLTPEPDTFHPDSERNLTWKEKHLQVLQLKK